jgi:hypothetical protein
VPATVEVTDSDTDVALVRIKGMVRLPFVARLDLAADEPAPGEILTSVGIDRGLHLTSWHTSVKNTVMVDLGKGGGPRRFIITSRPPDHGRSGGGLFRSDGVVVGVCTGHFGGAKGQQLGIFSAMASIRTLLQRQALEKTVRSPVHPLQ